MDLDTDFMTSLVGENGPTELSHAVDGQFVYYIQSAQFVKIGCSSKPEDRVKQLGRRGSRTSKPSIWAGNPALIGYEIGGPELEAERHQQFAHLHDQGEWFNLTAELADHAWQVRQEQAVLEVKLEQQQADHMAVLGLINPVTLDMSEQLDLALERTAAPDMTWRAKPAAAPKPQRDPRTQRERIARLMRAS